MIAAALTSLMILLFLGSWRSTVIIAASIPLAILAAVAALAAVGQTLNIMTLGGLALAVGILVDDATVTIENINWHLEQGKPVRDAILDGARADREPAFVSLLCICIVFVPMFFLPGVAGFLFAPMAMAVVFAMIASFILSRTLVPTMAKYLLRDHGGAHSVEVIGSHDAMSGRPASRNPLRPLPARLRAALRGHPRAITSRCSNSRWQPAAAVRRRLPGRRAAVVRAGADARAQLLPYGRCRADQPSTSARRSARGSRRPRRCSTASRTASARSSRPTSSSRSSTTSACRSAASTAPTPTPAASARRTATSWSRCRGPPADRRPIVRALREALPAVLPRLDLLLPARRHHQPDPELRRARADRPPGRRPRYRGGEAVCPQARCRDEPHPRHRRRPRPAIGDAIRSSTSTSTATQADRVGITERDVTNSLSVNLAGSLADRAGLLAQPEERRVLSDRRADARNIGSTRSAR